MVISRPKPWVNRFGKMSIFGLFELLVFIAYKDVFFFMNIVNKKYPGLYCLTKRRWKNDYF